MTGGGHLNATIGHGGGSPRDIHATNAAEAGDHLSLAHRRAKSVPPITPKGKTSPLHRSPLSPGKSFRVTKANDVASMHSGMPKRRHNDVLVTNPAPLQSQMQTKYVPLHIERDFDTTFKPEKDNFRHNGLWSPTKRFQTDSDLRTKGGQGLLEHEVYAGMAEKLKGHQSAHLASPTFRSGSPSVLPAERPVHGGNLFPKDQTSITTYINESEKLPSRAFDCKVPRPGVPFRSAAGQVDYREYEDYNEPHTLKRALEDSPIRYRNMSSPAPRFPNRKPQSPKNIEYCIDTALTTGKHATISKTVNSTNQMKSWSKAPGHAVQILKHVHDLSYNPVECDPKRKSIKDKLKDNEQRYHTMWTESQRHEFVNPPLNGNIYEVQQGRAATLVTNVAKSPIRYSNMRSSTDRFADSALPTMSEFDLNTDVGPNKDMAQAVLDSSVNFSAMRSNLRRFKTRKVWESSKDLEVISQNSAQNNVERKLQQMKRNKTNPNSNAPTFYAF